MCGIVGILQLSGDPVKPELLDPMTACLAHRGPDGAGTWNEGPVGFGHRRLAILDLSDAASQPMSTPDGRFTLVYNGELYNFVELRAELRKLGHRFRSSGDTEVVLRAWAQWGEEALDRFNGMFAFAVWDATEKLLHLARDRYGVKPLYWMLLSGTGGPSFLFASEIKAILAHPEVSVDLDESALVEYFTFQNLFRDRSLFRGVRMLAPGSKLCVRLRDGALRGPKRYWDFAFAEPTTSPSETELIEEFDHLFRQAVRRQLASDVEVGAYLSGGIDSGAISAVASRELPLLRTFTAGFDLQSASGVELTFDEREKAEYLSYLFGSEHYEVVLKAGDMERALPALTHHLEEPRVGQSYPNYYVAGLASRFNPVVLSGAGGDELFGGYPWRYYRAVVNDSFDHYLEKYYQFWQRLIPDSDRDSFFTPIRSAAETTDAREIFASVFDQDAHDLTRPEDFVNHALYFEAKTFLHGLLVVEDKLSMAHGLETRLPFLDNDLVEFAMRVPVGFKLGNLGRVVRLNENEPGPKTRRYFEKTRDGKLILRKALERFVPKEVSQRVKQGFSAPDASWFRGKSIEFVRDRLGNRRARLYDFLDRPTVQRLLDDHLTGRVNRRLLIWSLLSFDSWLETFHRN